MKIAVNTRFLLPDRLEGIGRVTHELLRRMVAKHPEDEFVFLFDRPWDQKFVYGDNVKPLHVFPPARHPLLWYWWFEYRVAAILRREGAAVFFSPDNYLSLRSEVPAVMVCHDLAHLHYPRQIPPLVRWFYDRYVPRYLRHAKRIVAVSEFTRKDIIRQYGIAADKISLVYNGCPDQFRPLDNDSIDRVRREYAGGNAYFLFVGAVHPRKNVARMIAAFDRFKERTGAPVRLLIGGRLAWQTATVHRAFESAAFRSDIRFLGRIAETELPRLTGAAFALVNVSLFEGFGLPVLESLNCRVPVIASDRSALPEVAGTAGLLVDPESVEAIAAAMTKLYSEPGLREQLAERCEAQAGKFSWDRAAEQVYELLREQASGKGS